MPYDGTWQIHLEYLLKIGLAESLRVPNLFYVFPWGWCLVCLVWARQQKFSLIIVLPLVLPLFSSQAITVVQRKRSLMARILLEHIVLVRFPRSSGSPATPWGQSKILPGNILPILFTPSQLACLYFRQQTILTFVNLINKNDMTEKLGK